ncbi:FliG C-terminal domain-containing protein [uncultured Roseobacter sp.]|uniref:flagellar motor switch protein FliG n=1 Tax=uncultured Roseobacter sp. TaxID=114847 RepID=UPI0026300C04|nr:FliG C-terminal domain-containing protein [uncultured Roseobacter sp.]
MVPMAPFPALPGTDAQPQAPSNLSRKAKAAIVVRLLLNEGADIPLEDLPEDLQAQLTKQMGAMRLVDRTTLSTVVAEFADELESIGLSFPGGIAGALDSLDGRISKQTAARLRKEAGVRQYGDPWARLRDMSADRLLPVLENESIEVAAVLLSKIDVPRAAELLGKLPGPKARRITYAVSQTSAVTPDAVDRIGLSLAAQLDAEPLKAFDDGPVERVGAILNSTASVTRDDVLEGLDETDAGFADLVRKAIFTFANIPKRIAARDIPRVIRELEQDLLITALAGSEAAGMKDSADFILENMSGRMADQLREEMGERDKVKPAEFEEATAEIVAKIREMEAAGDLLLVVQDSDED